MPAHSLAASVSSVTGPVKLVDNELELTLAHQQDLMELEEQFGDVLSQEPRWNPAPYLDPSWSSHTEAALQGSRGPLSSYSGQSCTDVLR